MVTQGVSWEVPLTVYAGHSLTEGWTYPFRHVLEQFLISQQLTKRKKTATSSLSLVEERNCSPLEPYNGSGPTGYEESEDPIRVAIQYS